MAGTLKRCMTGWAQWCPVRIATPSSFSSVPTSCGCTPSTANDSTAALRSAVPMMRTPPIRFTCSGRVVEQVGFVRGDRVDADAGQIIDAAPRPIAAAIGGVPASNLCGIVL